MDATIARDVLVRELGLMDGVIARKTTIPVLANALFRADASDGVSLAATDMDLSTRSRVAATVAEQGSETIPARKLYDLTRSLSCETIRLQSEGTGVVVTGGDYRAKMQTIAVQDFPALPDAPETWLALPRAVVSRLIALVRYAVGSGDDNRYFMTGARLEFGDGTIRMVATDGRRMAIADGKVAAASKRDAVIVPRSALGALASMSDGDGDDVEYATTESNLFFRVGKRILIARQLDGQFPDYARIVPKKSSERATVGRKPIASALSRAIMMSDAAKQVRFEFKSDSVKLSSRSAEVGEASERIAATFKGDAVGLTVSGGYVADFLDAIPTESVAIEPSDGKRPVVIRPVDGDKDIDFVGIVMPMSQQ